MTITLTLAVRRLPTLSFEEFDDYWQNVHGPLIARHAAALGYLSYVQIPTSLRGLSLAIGAARGVPEPFDGIAQIDFASAESMLEHARSPEVAELNEQILADERRFIDLSRSPLMLGDQRRIHPASAE